MKVTKETNIAKLLTEHPGTAEVFLEYGMHCAGCMAATFDSIEQGAKAHGLSDETVEDIVEKISAKIK
jgi:hybrid cluster-associated redox disulfide protein